MSNNKGNQQAADNRRDDDLVQAFLRGDEPAFEVLVHRHSGDLYRSVYAFLGSKQDAEEVVQDAFVHAYRGLQFFRGAASFKTWLYRIAINLARNRYQANKRRATDGAVSLNAVSDDESEEPVADIADSHAEPSGELERKELEKAIMLGLSELPDSLREVMILRHVDDLSYDEIAARLDCRLGTVKSRLARGREILRTKLLGSGVL